MLQFVTGILVLGVIAGIAYIVWRADELDEWEEELEKFSVHLDERANRIAADEATLTEEWKNLRAAAEEIRRSVK